MKNNEQFIIKSAKDLDVRAFNIFKNNFGNTDALLNYFRINGHFNKLRNAGLKTNIQLIYFCKYLLHKTESNSSDNSNEMNDSIQISSDEYITRFYGELKSNLSVRASNVIRQIEGDYNSNINEIIISFLSEKLDLLSIRNCGKKTKNELLVFFKNLNDKYELQKATFLKNEILKFDDSNIIALERFYLISKNNISIRGFNILSKLEQENNNDLSKLIRKIVLSQIDFNEIRNCGKLTTIELLTTAQRLKDFALYRKNPINNLTESNLIFLKTNLVFPKIPEKVVEQIVNNENSYDITKLMLAAVYFNDFRGNKCDIIQELFKTTSKISLESISSKLSISKERTRQILKDFFKNNIDEIFSKIGIHYSSFNNQFCEMYSRSFIKTDDIYFEYLNQTYTPHPNIKLHIYKSILKKDFENCLDIYESINSKINILNKSSLKDIFISKNLINSINFTNFLNWIEEELFNFEKYNVEFDMEVLVLRYFNSNNQAPIKLVKQLSEFISENKSNFAGTSIRRKGEREFKKIETINLCQAYIEQFNQPVKTNDLIEMLFKNGIQVNKQTLLKLLNYNKDLFSPFGNGNWALSTWRKNGFIGGSIRDIVITLLDSNEVPLHISEILNYLGQYKKTTLRSLLTNLKSANNGIFIFFNCNFIGIKSKKYSPSWNNLPKINSRHFGEVMLKIARDQNPNIPEYYYQKYKYPKINTEFYLNLKNYK